MYSLLPLAQIHPQQKREFEEDLAVINLDFIVNVLFNVSEEEAKSFLRNVGLVCRPCFS